MLKKYQIAPDGVKHELLKRKVLGAACAVMIETELDNDEVVITTILSAFPDISQVSDERKWLSMHFAVVLFSHSKISAEDVHMLRTTDVSIEWRR
jgi:uncharacterized protein YicC (UPF0701 family)